MAVLLLCEALVWAAVDAPEEEYPKALVEVRALGWEKVAGVLARGRDVKAVDRPAVTDPEELKKVLGAFSWEKGEVRTYRFGEHARAFYHLVAPRGEGPCGVYLDLGLGLGQLQAPPPGWAYVQPNWPMVVVMEEAGIPMSMTAGRDFQSLVLSILADVERHVPVERGKVYAGGYSRGGNAAWYFGIHWPCRFAGVIPASGYYPVDDAFLANLSSVRVLAGVGGDPGHRDSNRQTLRLAEKVDAEVFRAEGRAACREFAARAWEWMGEGGGEGLPSRVRFATEDPAHRGAYWVTIDEVERTGGRRPLRILEPGGTAKEVVYLWRRRASVDARALGDNRFEVKTSNVSKLVLHLSPEHVDFGREVEVELNGRTVTARAEPSVHRLLVNYRRARRVLPADLELSP